MKSFTTIFKNGQFYLKDGDKLVTPLNNTEVILIVEKETSLLIEDLKVGQFKPVSETQKENQVKHVSDRYAKILPAGAKLYFEVKVGKPKHIATVILQEDLYLYEKDTWKNSEAKLFDCICQMVSLEGNEVKEPITAPSVSDLYKRVYVHYNGNDGSASANAFSTFFTDLKRKTSTLHWIRERTALQNS